MEWSKGGKWDNCNSIINKYIFKKILKKKKKKTKTMNSKMTTNSQLLTSKHEKQQRQTKQTTRTGTEPQKWRSHGGLSAGRERCRMGEKVQGTRSIIGRYKIDRGRLTIIQEI